MPSRPSSEAVSATWPAAGRLDATSVADAFNAEIKGAIEGAVSSDGEASRPRLVGFLANGDPAGEMYAKMTKRACERNGVTFELRRPERVDLEAAVIDANADPAVHGILIYYPVFGAALDSYLRDVISCEKDVEGLSHRYRYSLYHNIRELDAGSGKKCVLPCTPLACVKVLEKFGAYDTSKPVGGQLAGRTAVVFNRSEVVGRPLAAMLANDGARVYSIDEHGMLLYTAGAVAGTIRVAETEVAQADALATADIVVSGVPAKGFSIAAAALRAGAICINVSQHMNFGEGVDAKCALVPAMGKVTISMLARNLIRLHHNFHRRAPGAGKGGAAAAAAPPPSVLSLLHPATAALLSSAITAMAMLLLGLPKRAA